MHNLLKKAGAIALAMAMAFSMVPYAAFAAGDAATGAPGETDSSITPRASNRSNDISDSDTIDVNKKGSIHIYKYDTTSAEAAGKYHEGDIKATGQEDTAVSDALKDFVIQGVEFTYLKVGDVETYSDTTENGSDIVVVYEVPDTLSEILGLDTDNVYDATSHPDGYFDMTKTTVATPCTKDNIHHYNSTQISDALKALIDADDVIAKNALEGYLVDYHTQAQQSSDSSSRGDTDDQVVNEAAATGAVTGKLVTDANGEASATDLPLGLYLIVETRVPEEVTETVNPWFVSLPFTNISIQETADDHGHETAIDTEHPEEGFDHTDNGVASNDNDGGDYWLYNFYAYPKNQTGNPTFDKSVRNSYSAVPGTASTKGNKNDMVNLDDTHTNTTYDSTIAATDALRHAVGLGGGTEIGDAAFRNGTNPIVVFNEKDGDHQADTNAKAYVANRGGYTNGDNTVAGEGGEGYSKDFTYGDVTTASEGDVLDYILVTKLPHITSKATYLSKYTFTDVLSKGLTFNQDPQIAFYSNKADAVSNNTKKAIETWAYNRSTGKFGKDFAQLHANVDGEGTDGCTRMTITMTEAGLNQINAEPDNQHLTIETPETSAAKDRGLSDYYMVVYYTATVESNDQVTMGDNGNANDATLVWSRTNNTYDNSLQDRNYVYTYGIDLTKTFSKTDANNKFRDVEFKLYNDTDAYYVRAVEDPEASGIYYVTGKANTKEDATTFIPCNEGANKGRLWIKGLEADKYGLTEVKTADGYTVLRDEIVIDIKSTERDIKASVAGTVGLTPENSAAIIENYGTSIKMVDGSLVTDESGKTGIKNEDDQYVDDASTDVGNKAVPGPKSETANGRTIGKTDMYVGDIQEAQAWVDGKRCDLLTSSTGDTLSKNAEVKMSVLNQKNWTLPQTGGAGLYLITILGILALAGGVAMNKKKKVA